MAIELTLTSERAEDRGELACKSFEVETRFRRTSCLFANDSLQTSAPKPLTMFGNYLGLGSKGGELHTPAPSQSRELTLAAKRKGPSKGAKYGVNQAKADASTKCQKCLAFGHYSYACTGKR
jgi:hypothetical protein